MDMQPAPSQGLDQDQPLFEAIRDGDEGALSELIDRHGRWVRGVVFAVLGQSHELDDVCQQVWLTVWRRARTLDKVERWRYWLYRTARNAALDAGRKRRRRQGLWQTMRGLAAGSEQTVADAPQHLQLQEQHQRVLQAIQKMPAIYREPFVLRHLQEWSYRQIAQAMDMPIDTVETRLVRARRLLRKMLTEQMGDL